MQQCRDFFKNITWQKELPSLCTGLFSFSLGVVSLLFGETMRGRMMLLVGLCSCLWGVACIQSALKQQGRTASVMRGVYFALFGAAILLSNLGGVMFSARVLGTMLFLYGAAPLALLFAEKNGNTTRLVHCIVYALLGSILVLFSGQQGILCALCMTLCGICILHESITSSYIFCIRGDAKDNLT